MGEERDRSEAGERERGGGAEGGKEREREGGTEGGKDRERDEREGETREIDKGGEWERREIEVRQEKERERGGRREGRSERDR